MILILILLLCSSAQANSANPMFDNQGHIIGVKYDQIEVNGKSYDVPIANKDYRDDIYYLKKALHGDKEALDIFLKGEEKRAFNIGSERPQWLIAHKDGKFEVI